MFVSVLDATLYAYGHRISNLKSFFSKLSLILNLPNSTDIAFPFEANMFARDQQWNNTRDTDVKRDIDDVSDG
jgi:hypothetical protein